MTLLGEWANERDEYIFLNCNEGPLKGTFGILHLKLRFEMVCEILNFPFKVNNSVIIS